MVLFTRNLHAQKKNRKKVNCEGVGWQELIVGRDLKNYLWGERGKKNKKKRIYTHIFSTCKFKIREIKVNALPGRG